MKITSFLLTRYLFLSWARNKKMRQGSAVSVLIPVIGVAVGVFAFIVVISVMSGFVENIQKNMLHFEPHITIVSKKRGEQIPQNLYTQTEIQQLNESILTVSPFQSSDVILQSGNRAIIANLQGIDSLEKKQSLIIEKYLNYGSKLSDLNKDRPSLSIKNSSLFPSVILGIDLMRQLNLHVGDTVTLVSPLMDEGPNGLSPIQFPVVISGYLNSGHFSFDKKMVLASLQTVNLFLQTSDLVEGYTLTIQKPQQADSVAKKINENLNSLQKNGLHLKAVPWTEKNRSLLKALTLEHYGMVFVFSMIILVGCFSITISLLLSIRRKSKEMAILRSLGYQQFQLSKLYIWQGFIIGLSGVVIGLFLGLSCLYYIHHHTIPFLTSAYSSEPLPVLLSLKDVSIVIVGSILLSMLAAVWPAYEVKNLNVVEILSIRN